MHLTSVLPNLVFMYVCKCQQLQEQEGGIDMVSAEAVEASPAETVSRSQCTEHPGGSDRTKTQQLKAICPEIEDRQISNISRY